MLHGPSHAAALKRMQRKTKRGTFNRHDTNTIGTQHRKPTPIKAHLNRRLKRRAQVAVAARAGIRQARAHQAPLTRPAVRNAREGASLSDQKQCKSTALDKQQQAHPSICPVEHDASPLVLCGVHHHPLICTTTHLCGLICTATHLCGLICTTTHLCGLIPRNIPSPSESERNIPTDTDNMHS
ncbi:hypothetical protein ABFS83_07G110500 [Erythranthe nasuta]